MRLPILPLRLPLATLALALLSTGCGGGGSAPPPEPTCLQTGCAAGLVCETVVGAAPACFGPVLVTGRVFDAANADSTANGLAGARVVGQDVNGAPISPVALTTTTGAYQLAVRAVRSPGGAPAAGSVTLRVDREDYEPFPSGLRTALPIALSGATVVNGRWTVRSDVTDVALAPLQTPAAGKIVGTVQAMPAGGALVVAESGGAAYTAVPGSDGSFAIFNVPDGVTTVAAYAKGANYGRATVTVNAAGTNPVTATLARTAVPAATVRGGLNFVAATQWDFTSILLVVASTFDPVRVRGLVPPGLRAGGITKTSGWTIAGIPDGHYRVLAAFETDYLVRDPSDIGGAAVLEFQVRNGVPLLMDGTTSAALLEQFKITGAVRLTAPLPNVAGVCTTSAAPLALPANPALLGPRPCSTTSLAPSFAWEAYSATDAYELTVLNDRGLVAWRALIDGTQEAVTYGSTDPAIVDSTLDPAVLLTTGGTYQVRLKSLDLDNQGAVIGTKSVSEDLLGVFRIVP